MKILIIKIIKKKWRRILSIIINAKCMYVIMLKQKQKNQRVPIGMKKRNLPRFAWLIFVKVSFHSKDQYEELFTRMRSKHKKCREELMSFVGSSY